MIGYRDYAEISSLQDPPRSNSPYGYIADHDDFEDFSISPISRISRNKYLSGLTLEAAIDRRCAIEDEMNTGPSYKDALASEKLLIGFDASKHVIAAPRASDGVLAMLKYYNANTKRA